MKVALTQSRGRLESLTPLLEARGFEVIRTPLLETTPRTDAATRTATAKLAGLPWILLTSRSTVQALHTLDFDFRAAARGPIHVGAVGPGTAAAVEAHGGRVSLIGAPPDAVGLARAFLAHRAARGPVGLPRGNWALTTLEEALGEAGVVTLPLVVYDSRPLPWKGDGADVVVLSSPSAVAALPEATGRSCRLVTLGSTTAEAVRARGWICEEAERPTASGALSAVERVST